MAIFLMRSKHCMVVCQLPYENALAKMQPHFREGGPLKTRKESSTRKFAQAFQEDTAELPVSKMQKQHGFSPTDYNLTQPAILPVYEIYSFQQILLMQQNWIKELQALRLKVKLQETQIQYWQDQCKWLYQHPPVLFQPPVTIPPPEAVRNSAKRQDAPAGMADFDGDNLWDSDFNFDVDMQTSPYFSF